MTRAAAILIVITLAASAARAQSPATAFPAAATLPRSAPVFWLRDADSTRILLLPAGTPVQVLRRDGPWYRVRFSTPEGDQLGLITPWDVRIDPLAEMPAAEMVTGSVASRGFVDLQGMAFSHAAPQDARRAIGDALVRQELSARPARWLQLAMGLDLRSSSHGQVDDAWTLDVRDRGLLRPRASLRRLSAAITTRRFTLDLGKQFIRWGRTDVLSPVDRFAPRDYLNLVNSEFIPVIGARLALHAAGETVELVWLPEMTPSRLPLLDQRWAPQPLTAGGAMLQETAISFPTDPQLGARWSHSGRFEAGVSYFDGVSHLPEFQATPDLDRNTLALSRTFPRVRSYGGEIAVPTRALTLKGEAAYFTSPAAASDDYVLYVVEVERQVGEWLIDAGYAGEIVTTPRAGAAFAAERGMARSVIGRVAYTISPTRTVQVEGAARQSGHGTYLKGEYSQTLGRHWRLTLAAAGLGGRDDDFLGQYSRNSHASATLRLSY
ncbi:MAG: hypothetical protein IT184_10075 [Acidobacteria bacterium]|nr:hypothetical protein [Acidobacteriota bacterium]